MRELSPAFEACEPAVGLAVFGDSSQIEQVLIKLALNARAAMPGGGRLRISLEGVELGGKLPLAHPDARPGPYARISVDDSGTAWTEPPARVARVRPPSTPHNFARTVRIKLD